VDRSCDWVDIGFGLVDLKMRIRPRSEGVGRDHERVGRYDIDFDLVGVGVGVGGEGDGSVQVWVVVVGSGSEWDWDQDTQ